LPAAAVTPAAAGALRALAGLLAGGAAVAVVLAVALLVSGGRPLALHAGSAALLSLGFACASTATIVALAGVPRVAAGPAAAGLRAPTLALVFAIATAWTASALPLWVAIPATLLTGLVVTADGRARDGERIGGRAPVAAMAGAGALLLVVAAATAQPRPEPTAPAHAGAALLAPARPEAARSRQTTPTASVPAHATPAPTTSAPAHATPAPTTSAPAHATPAPTTSAPAPPPPAPTTSAPPEATPAPAIPDGAAPAPAEFIRSYYAALDDHRFADAWKRLSPAVKARFGTFAHWRAGYATTLASTPQDVRVTPAADGSAIVRHVLAARDRTACGGTREQRFAVTWKLAPAAGGWTVASLSATAAGPAETTPCR
jgi:hypothetical protein